jgi:hypothetical protein
VCVSLRPAIVQLLVASWRSATAGYTRGGAYSVVGLDEGVVHGDNVDVVVLDSIAEDDTANATESVDTDL